MENIKYKAIEEYLEWNRIKGGLKFSPPVKKFMILYNCIYWAYMGCNIGSEEGKHRPVIVTRTYKNSSICTVIPLTSQRLQDGYWYHIDLENRNSTALVEQMRTIDINRIEKPFHESGKIARICKKDWENINNQISVLYKLSPLSKENK